MPQIIPPITIPVPRLPHLAPNRQARPRITDQADASPLAEKALRTTLLAAQATELAIGPPETLRDLLTRARRFLPRQQSVIRAGRIARSGESRDQTKN